MKRFAIAVDGPAGSGKSTVAKLVAKRLGIIYVDTGAMYRTVALFCTEKGIALADEAAVVAALADLQMKIVPEEGGQRIFLNGRDVTEEIRTAEIGKGASTVAAYRQVDGWVVLEYVPFVPFEGCAEIAAYKSKTTPRDSGDIYPRQSSSRWRPSARVCPPCR